MIASCLLCLAPLPSEPPNVVLVVIDDLGYADLGTGLPGLPGRSDHRTPNVEAFARQGVVFTHGYSAAPNCAPSRASLQTGRWTPRHRVLTVGSSRRGKPKDRELVPIANEAVLEDGETTLAEMLEVAGYTSAHVGKWHLGEDPCSQGYGVNVGGTAAGHPKSYFAPYRNSALEDGPEGESLTRRMTDEAIELVDRLEPPFLLHLSYFAVHTPLQAPSERIAEREAAGARHPTYAAMVEAVDEEFGRLLRSLDQRELAADTVVIFTSDNGGHGRFTERRALRGAKGTLDEGGIRVPWIVRWPGRVEPAVRATPVHHVDLFPTLAALAGVELESSLDVAGIDLSPLLLTGAPPDARSLFWHFPCYLEGSSDRFPKFRTVPGGIVRSGDWKLIQYFAPADEVEPRVELYDLRSDPRETTDRGAEAPERVEDLLDELVAWRSTVGARVPSTREPAFEPR